MQVQCEGDGPGNPPFCQLTGSWWPQTSSGDIHGCADGTELTGQDRRDKTEGTTGQTGQDRRDRTGQKDRTEGTGQDRSD